MSHLTRSIAVGATLAFSAGSLVAQISSSSSTDSLKVRTGSEIAIPLGSFVLPGLGQYIHGAPAKGLAYSAVYLGGAALGFNNSSDTTDFPRTDEGQRGDVGLQFAGSAMWLSAWDAFHRGVPAMQQRGKYRFLPKREGLSQLLSAPFDYRFLGRWTTWVDLAQTAAITAIVLSDRSSNEAHYPYRAQDAAYTVSLSANAAIGEEAFFRGYLLPMLYQKNGGKFWVANASQGLLFGAGHGLNAFNILYQGGWGMWEGWLTRRNDWSIRESVFHHFWYDFAVVSAAAVAEEKPLTVRIRFPSIPF